VDVIVWTTARDYENLLQVLLFLKTFLHVCCVPALITFSSFIRFWYICNNRKVYEVSYEFFVSSFLE
jgi:hypothetical protein